MRTFLDTLFDRRGTFLHRIDNLLGPLMAEIVAGKRPVRTIDYDKTMTRMKKEPMDAEYFINLTQAMVDSTNQDA